MKTLTVFAIVLLSITGLKGWPAGETGLTEREDRRKTCNACNALVSFVDRVTTNDTNLLQNAFINMCNDYSSLPGKQTKQMCEYMTKDVLDLFKNSNKKTFCQQIRACPGFTGPLSSEKTSTVSDDPTCNFCVTVVTNIKDIISGGPTELEVKYFVEDACHYLGSFENECVSLSDEYLDNLFKFIRESLQPKQLCQSLGACNTSLQSAKPNQKVADISEIINIFPPQPQPSVVPLMPLRPAESVDLPKDIECEICKQVVGLIVRELKDNRTEEAIIQALENVCSLLPSSKRQKCDAFVEEYTNELIHILIEEGDPGLACTLLGVCVPNSVYKAINKDIEREDTVKWTEIESPIEVEGSDSKQVSSSVDIKKDNKACYECELLMHFIQNEIYDYNNEEQVEEFIEHQLCDRLTIVVTKEACDTFVQQYGPHIMQLIAQKVFDPSNVCYNELKLCGNSTAIQQTSAQDFQMSGPEEKCELCVSLVQQIDSLLENEQFDKEVAKMAEKTCNSLPKAKKVECELMIEAFAPYFLQAIGHMTDAKQVCRSIDMCYSSGSVQLLGGHKCTYGPTYWCHTIAHAEACKATHFCKNKVWKAIP